MYFERNCLPIVPPVIALSCLGMRVSTRWAAGIGWTPVRQMVVSALIVLPLLGQAEVALQHLRHEVARKRVADTRTTAYAWTLENLPRGSRVLREAFTPHLSPERCLCRDLHISRPGSCPRQRSGKLTTTS